MAAIFFTEGSCTSLINLPLIRAVVGELEVSQLAQILDPRSVMVAQISRGSLSRLGIPVGIRVTAVSEYAEEQVQATAGSHYTLAK
jgi:hypothetical protein